MSDFPVKQEDIDEIKKNVEDEFMEWRAEQLLAAIDTLVRWARHGWQASATACDELTAEAQRLGLYEEQKP